MSGSTGASWTSSSVVPSVPSVSDTASHDTIPPNSHVTANARGWSQDSTVPPALPTTWYVPPSASSPVTGRNQRGIRSGLVRQSHRSARSVGYARRATATRVVAPSRSLGADLPGDQPGSGDGVDDGHVSPFHK